MGFYQQGRNQCRPSSGDHISKQALRFRQDVIWSQKSEKIKKKVLGSWKKQRDRVVISALKGP